MPTSPRRSRIHRVPTLRAPVSARSGRTNPRRALFVGLAALGTLALAGCVPHVTEDYVPDVPSESLVHSPCAFNTRLPTGARLRLGRATAIVTLSEHAGRPYVEVHFEVPPGTEIQLEDDAISLATHAGGPARSFGFPSVSLVDTPIVNSHSTLPALRAQQLPVRAPLTGAWVDAGSNRSGRHFWLATFVETGGAPTVFVTLPRMTIDAVSREGPRLAFTRRRMTAMALLNC